MANVVVSAISTFNNKGLKKAKKEVSAFEKQVKTYAKTFAAAFSGRALINYTKTAIRAFAADEKAAKSLEIQLRNTGFAFSAPGVEQYIASLQGLYGVLDDELRPAFQQLLTATGSITKSQDALQSALNISAATGRSLTEVSAALTRGFSGNTAGLSRLGAGISKATLKTGDMDKIMAELNNKFAGQATARLDTYAGKMSLLAVASADAQEIIGKGLVDALTALGDDNSVGNLTIQMNDLAQSTANVVAGIGELAAKFKVLGNIPFVNELLLGPIVTRSARLLGSLGAATRPARELPANEQRSAGRISAQQRKLELQAIKNGVALRKQENVLLKAKTAVDLLRDKFDLERIGLNAALNAAVDEETKLRIRAQIAILDNNEALAKKILAEMEAADAAKKLAASYDTALSSIKSLISRINDFILKQGGTPPVLTAAAPTYAYALSTAKATNEKIAAFENKVAIESTQELNSRINDFLSQNAQRTSSQSQMDIKVTVDAGGDRLSQAIAESIQVASRSGYSTVPAGFIA